MEVCGGNNIVMKYVEFSGLRDKGVHEYGKIVLKDGKLIVEGERYLKDLLNKKVRDLRPNGNQEWVGKDKPGLFLRILPYYYCGTYLCASRVRIEE